MKHLNRLKMLIQIAKDVTPVSHAKVASSIYYKNTLISIGFNQKKSHPLQAKHGRFIFLHAEIHAIINALNSSFDINMFKKCTIYIARYKKSTEWGLSKPCEGCESAITYFGCREVIYTLNEIDNFERIKF